MYSRQKVSNTSLAGFTSEPVSRVEQVLGSSDTMGAKAGVIPSKTGGKAGVVQQRET